MFSSLVSSLRVSPTLAAMLRQRQSASPDLAALAFGQSPFPPPLRLATALASAARHRAAGAYADVRGIQKLREAIARRHSSDVYAASTAAGRGTARTAADAATADDVIVAPGSKEMLFATMLCLGGESRAGMRNELLLPQPSWVSYAPQGNPHRG